jgi:hypothetical protein
MPRRDTSHIRTLTLRLDVSKSDEAAIYAHYTALTARRHGSAWIRDVLAKALAGDSTTACDLCGVLSPERDFLGDMSNIPQLRQTVITPVAKVGDGNSTPPEVIAPFVPPAHARTNVFAQSDTPRPIPAVVGRKTNG